MKMVHWMSVGLVVVLTGCGNTDTAQNAATEIVGSIDSNYIADSEPAGAIPVGDVTLVGTIGGSPEPFVQGLAAFTIVDPKVPHCAPEEGCPQPWDYCCKQDQVKDNIATVKIVDDSGSPVSSDARALLGVTELSTVVVEGTAKRDVQGNLSVAATKVIVRSGE